ncbi:MAG TPA: hypothetical protein EYP52_06805 [Anaerolineae bacterium]|nr:hypothetical protein [Anaerolineae bacterium]
MSGSVFDFQALGIALAGVSLGGIGAMMAGAFLFPEWAERAKQRLLPTVLGGLVLLGVSGIIMAALGG